MVTATVLTGCGAGSGAPRVSGVTRTSFTTKPTVSILTRSPGRPFARGAIGLSTETSELQSGRLSSTRRSLVTLMRLLGPGVLRVGGDSTDSSWWTSAAEAPPSWATNTVTPADLQALDGLLDATGWRAIVSVDLGHYEPARASSEAAAASQILGDRLLGIEVGNEPNGYTSAQSTTGQLRPSSYDAGTYLHEAAAYTQAIGSAAPGVITIGPGVNGTRWLVELGGEAGLFDEVSLHFYYSSGERCPAASAQSLLTQPTPAGLLSSAVLSQESEAVAVLTHTGSLTGRPVRITETGTGRCNGNSPASPTFASALWALDWSLRASSDGVAGLQFHGRFGLCPPNNQAPICAPDPRAARLGEVQARPEFYGMLAASRLEGGRFLPVSVAGTTSAEVTAYATLAASGTVRLAIDNMSQTTIAGLRLLAGNYTAASVSYLAAPSLAARARVTLGESAIGPDGGWHPRAHRIRRSGGAFVLTLPGGTAAIVTLRRGR